jgi:hypothetical protein
MLIDPTASIVAQEFERCDTSPGKNLYTLSGPSSPYTPVNSGNLQYGDASAAASFSVKAPASPFVLAVRDSSSGQDLFVNGTKYTSATVPASATLTAFKWGYTSGVSLDQFWANFRGTAHITVSGNVSDHDIQQITRCLLYRWLAANDKLPRVALIGDSISEGVAALLTQNGPFWWRDDIGQPVELYNWGIAGKFLSDCYNDRAATDGTIYASDRPIVYVIQAGINDIHAGGASGATVYGASAAANTTWGYVSYLKGLATAAGKTNVRVIVCTLPPQTAHVTTTIETQRKAYNDLVAPTRPAPTMSATMPPTRAWASIRRAPTTRCSTTTRSTRPRSAIHISDQRSPPISGLPSPR